MRFKHPVIFLGLLFAGQHAFAQAASPADTVLGLLQTAMVPAVDRLTSQAITWLGAFATLQFFITHYSVIKNDGDIQQVIAKTAGAVAWVSVCIYLINHAPQFISSVGLQFFDIVGFAMPSPGTIIANTVKIVASLAALAVAVGGVGIVGSQIAGQLLLYILLGIGGVGIFFAFKIFMVQLEVALVAMLSPISFAFLGMSALKDQGIAPFKALISLGYRIILLSIFLSAFGQVSTIASNAITGITADVLVGGIGKAIDTILMALCSYILLMYLVYKSDSIAASLASGGTSMGTADVASAAAAGAAAGALVASAGAATAGAASQGKESMSEFMKSLGDNGSMSNASSKGQGTGFEPGPAAPKETPPAFSTARDGTPLPPPGAESPASGSVGPEAPIGQAPKTEEKGAPQEGGGEGGDSGSKGGIAGPGSQLEKDLGKLVEHLGTSKKPTVRDHLGATNQHIAQEKAATHVSVSTNLHE